MSVESNNISLNTIDNIDLSIVSLQLFNGEHMYGKRKDKLRDIFENYEIGKEYAKEIVRMRGNDHLIDKSDLDLFNPLLTSLDYSNNGKKRNCDEESGNPNKRIKI